MPMLVEWRQHSALALVRNDPARGTPRGPTRLNGL